MSKGNYSGAIVWRAKVRGVIILEGISWGGAVVRGAVVQGGLVSGHCPGDKISGGNCTGRNFTGGNCAGGSCLGGELSLNQKFDKYLLFLIRKEWSSMLPIRNN